MEIVSQVLKTIAICGAVGLAMTSPHAASAILKELKKKKKKYSAYWYERKTIERLKGRGSVELFERDGKTFARITKKGKSELKKHTLRANPEMKEKWDGKWRVVIFDIQEKRRKTRDHLRRELENFGFRRLQNSVWISPYECDEAVALLKADLHIGKDVLYFVGSDMENDGALRKIFQLK